MLRSLTLVALSIALSGTARAEVTLDLGTIFGPSVIVGDCRTACNFDFGTSGIIIGLPNSGTANAGLGMATATATWDLSQAAFEMGFDLGLGMEASETGVVNTIRFTVLDETPYEFCGSFDTTSFPGNSVAWNLLFQRGSTETVYQFDVVSEMTTDESFVLGEADGDSLNSFVGAQSGTLQPGSYTLAFAAAIDNLAGPSPAVTGTGVATLKLPEPSSASLHTTLLALLGAGALRRRSRPRA